MQIPRSLWNKYIWMLSELEGKAAEVVAEYIDKNFAPGELADASEEKIKALVDYGFNVANYYGTAESSLACEMYDKIARYQNANVPSAEPAELPTYSDIAKSIRGTRKSSKTPERQIPSVVSRKVKQVSADTMLKNALRDGAQFAWVPSGDTCEFCIMLASNGWQYASKKTIKNGHADHIHSNCDCTYAIRFGDDVDIAGYNNGKKYKDIYEAADGADWKEKMSSMRSIRYQRDKDNTDLYTHDKDSKINHRSLKESLSIKSRAHFITRGMTDQEYADYKREISSASICPTVNLGKEEYEMVRHAFNQYIYNSMDNELQKRGVVTKEVRNHKYTVINYGFDNYRIIKVEKIK